MDLCRSKHPQPVLINPTISEYQFISRTFRVGYSIHHQSRIAAPVINLHSVAIDLKNGGRDARDGSAEVEYFQWFVLVADALQVYAAIDYRAVWDPHLGVLHRSGNPSPVLARVVVLPWYEGVEAEVALAFPDTAAPW